MSPSSSRGRVAFGVTVLLVVLLLDAPIGAYSADYAAMIRRATFYVDRILKGAAR